MKRLAILLPLLLVAQDPRLDEDGPLQRLESRVAALERAVPPAPPLKLWTNDEATKLQVAVDALCKGPASMQKLMGEHRGALPEAERGIFEDAAHASALLTRAQWAAVKRGPLRASELCEEALTNYNRAAKALGLPPHVR